MTVMVGRRRCLRHCRFHPGAQVKYGSRGAQGLLARLDTARDPLRMSCLRTQGGQQAVVKV